VPLAAAADQHRAAGVLLATWSATFSAADMMAEAGLTHGGF
jgi:hypothetical protein